MTLWRKKSSRALNHVTSSTNQEIEIYTDAVNGRLCTEKVDSKRIFRDVFDCAAKGGRDPKRLVLRGHGFPDACWNDLFSEMPSSIEEVVFEGTFNVLGHAVCRVPEQVSSVVIRNSYGTIVPKLVPRHLKRLAFDVDFMSLIGKTDTLCKNHAQVMLVGPPDKSTFIYFGFDKERYTYDASRREFLMRPTPEAPYESIPHMERPDIAECLLHNWCVLDSPDAEITVRCPTQEAYRCFWLDDDHGISAVRSRNILDSDRAPKLVKIRSFKSSQSSQTLFV